MTSNEDTNSLAQLNHLYRRMAPGNFSLTKVPRNLAVDQLFENSKQYVPFDYKRVLEKEPDESTMLVMSGNSDQRQDRIKRDREDIRNMNSAWVNKMVNGESALRERMSLFWHGHFACRHGNPGYVKSYIETIRKHSLGNFGEMLLAVSKEPAMLQFLNNQQNRKDRPNENFAREVMELFTLGIGNYTELDVKEIARAFTGWGFDVEGNFTFRERLHDNGIKKFLGKQGNFQGDDAINIILEKKETAHFITSKIYRSFVSEVPDKKRIDKLASDFYKSEYNIEVLLRNILKSDWFYDNSPDNLLIKSPVELIVGIQGTLNATFSGSEPVLYVQKILGQVLFYPQNVAGWPGGRNWIDSSSLLFRMQLPVMMAGNGVIKVKVKDSGDVNDLSVDSGRANRRAAIDWNKWAERFDGVKDGELTALLSGLLLAINPSKGVMEFLSEISTKETDRYECIKKLTLAIMGLPEYQIA